MLKDLKQFMFYDRPPQLNVPVEHQTTTRGSVVEVKHATPPPTPPPPVLKTKATNNGVFSPPQKDTLFWCFYKIMHDELPEIINVAVEKTLKIQYV